MTYNFRNSQQLPTKQWENKIPFRTHLEVPEEGQLDEVLQDRVQDLLVNGVHRLVVAAAVFHHSGVLPRGLKPATPPPEQKLVESDHANTAAK
jgi:hypothetical protein